MDENTRPRVLIFSLAYFPLVGGAEIAVKEITDRLGGGFDFDLVTLGFGQEWPREENIGQVSVFRLKKGLILPKVVFAFKGAILAQKLHSRRPYRLVWSIMAAYAGLAGLFFKFLCPKVPMFLTLQEGDSEEHILRRVGPLYHLWRLIFKKADHIQAISNHLADFARRHGAICPIEVIPNGVDLAKFQIPNSKFQVNPKPQNPNVKTIVTTSRLVYKNGIDILVRAVSLLLTTNYKLQTIIVGDGPDRAKLEKLAKDLDIADKVKFVGHVGPDLIPQYLYQADVFARPSRSEGLGSSFLEAMAAGLPVVGTSVGGIVDFLKDGETGLVCKVDDSQDLAEKIIRVLSDAELSKSLSEAGRKLVESKYSWDFIAQDVSRKFVNLLNPNPPTPSLKKLLLATGIYPPEIGGPATYAALLEKELPARGVDVTVLPFRVVRNWPVGIRHFFYFLKSVRLGWEHDLVLAQDTISVGLPSMFTAKLLKKRFLIRVPGDYAWEQSVQRFGVKDSIDDFQKKKYGWRVEFLRGVQRFVVNRADVVITPSKYFRELVSGWVKNKSKVVTIYNGIDLVTSNKQQATSKSKIIVSAGRLVPWKGFGMVIEMMRDLPEWRLIIIGDGPERETLELSVISHGLQGRVMLTGAIPREMVLEYLSQAEVFVLNTSFESFSYQVVEAMSLGVPVITTNIGNISEIVRDGVDGILVVPNNKSGFLSAIGQIDSNAGLRNTLSANAMARSKEFSIGRTLDNLMRILVGQNDSAS